MKGQPSLKKVKKKKKMLVFNQLFSI